jgi:hypothetical protein
MLFKKLIILTYDFSILLEQVVLTPALVNIPSFGEA